tara:strand:+ start:1983 stop:2255 length:273 start_codon:yes stop_codon:yes gene_type:complete
MPCQITTEEFPTHQGASSNLLNKNTLTTCGVLIGSSTVVASVGMVALTIPAQMSLAAGASAGLIYLGDRKSKGLPLVPSIKVEKPQPAEV